MRWHRPIQRGLWLLGGLLLSQLTWATTPVSLQLRWLHQFQFAGYYAAIHKGFYAQEGLEVTLKQGGVGIEPVTEVLSGRAQFGVSNAGLIADYLNGRSVLMLAPIFQHSPNVLLVRGDVATPTELVDAGPIALMGGDQDIDLKAMFVNEGIPLQRLAFTQAGGHLDDLINGKVKAIHAYLSNEPFELELRGVPYSVLKPQSYGMDFYSDVLFTEQDYAKAHPEVVAAFRRASFRGWQYALQHSDEIITLIEQHYNSQGKTRAHLQFEASIIKKLIQPELIELGHSNIGRWQFIANTFVSFGLAPPNKKLESFFYQPDKNRDWILLYPYLLALAVVLVLLSSVVWYIHRINRRLRLALQQQSVVETRLRESELRYRVFFETAPSAGLVWTEGFVVTDWNHRAEEMFGWKRSQVIGRNFFEFLIPESVKSQLQPELEGLLQRNIRPHTINEVQTEDGRVIVCEWFNDWLPDVPGKGREVISLAIDITQRLQMEQALQRSERRYRMLTETMKDVVWTLNTQTLRFTYVSPSVYQLRGVLPEEVMQQPLDAALPPAEQSYIRALIHERREALLAGEIGPDNFFINEVQQPCADGRLVWTEVITRYWLNTETGEVELHGVTRDISERKTAEAQIRHMAQHDALTGLANRALFSECLQRAMAVARREKSKLGLLFLDLDRFKPVNDVLGHAVGDALLQLVAKRIGECVREADTVARLGGDEFVVLLHGVQQAADCVYVGEKIRQALSAAFQIDTHTLHISSSIGVAVFPDHGENEIELTQHADHAMYQAKNSGRDSVQLFTAVGATTH